MELVPFVLIQHLLMIHQDNVRNVRSRCRIASSVYQHFSARSANQAIIFIIPLVFPTKHVSTSHIFTQILCCKYVLAALLLATPVSIKHIVLLVLLAICSTAIVLLIALQIIITWEACALNVNFLA